MINLKTKIAGFEYECILMNASGVHCYDKKELTELSASNATTLITKSATRDFREGNPEPRCVELALGSINSMGLPNLGFAYYFDCNQPISRRTEYPFTFNFRTGIRYDF